MESEFKRTSDHETIRKWIEVNNGIPVEVSGIEDENGIGIAFGVDIDTAARISWEEFFELLDTNGLVFQYLDEVEKGDERSAYNFISADAPSDTIEDETELAEDNEMGSENLSQEQ